MAMPRCCIRSFCYEGIQNRFRLAFEGQQHVCGCGRIYEMRAKWKLLAFRCPKCSALSYNVNDAAQAYCGRCHEFQDKFHNKAVN